MYKQLLKPESITDYVLSRTTITTCSGIIADHSPATVNYADAQDIIQPILPATPGKLVKLTFQEMNTELNFDKVYIYDGDTSAANLLGVFSGTRLPPSLTASNAAGKLTLRFKSDLSLNFSGFKAVVSCADYVITRFSPQHGRIGETVTVTGSHLEMVTSLKFNGRSSPFTLVNGNTITTTVPAGATSGPLNFTAAAGNYNTWQNFIVGDVSYMTGATIYTCDGVIIDHETGPSYADNTNRIQEIWPGTAGRQVRIQWQSFKTEPVYDYVRIFDGDTNGTLLGTYSGNELPPTFTATNLQGRLTIHFVSDNSVGDDGFSFSVSCADFSVRDYTPKHGMPGTVVTINGTGLNVTGKVKFNGAPANVTARNANTIVAVVPAGASTGSLSVHSAADSVYPNRCFQVDSFYVLSGMPVVACSGRIMDHDGCGNYENNLSVIQEIRPGIPGKTIKIHFENFRTEAGNDVLKIYEGDLNGRLIGTYSGSNTPPDIYADNAEGKLSLVFTTNSGITDNGFSLSFSCENFPVPDITSVIPANIRAGFPYTVYTNNGQSTDSLFLDGVTVTGAVFSGNSWKGLFPTGSSSGRFMLKNMHGQDYAPTDINVLPGNYCLGKNEECTGNETEKITLVAIAGSTLHNSSACNLGLIYNNIAWPADDSTTAKLEQGRRYTLSLVSAGVHIAAAWLDYNRDGQFSNEEFFSISPLTTPNVPATADFTVPESAVTGRAVLRLRTRTAGNFINPSDACTDFLSGEGEDYTVTITFPVGTKQYTGKNTPAVWPNPGNGNFSIDLSTSGGPGVISVSDCAGRPVFRKAIDGSESGKIINADLTGNPAGIYLLETVFDGIKKVQKLLIKE
ncbi:MAG: CUB domain-containing protein [Bacteroidota bacterium]